MLQEEDNRMLAEEEEEGPVELALFEMHRLVSVICLVEAYQNSEVI